MGSPCFVSRKCYRRNWEGGRTAIGRSATTCAKSSRLARIWVIVCIVRSAVANARGSSGRGGGQRLPIRRVQLLPQPGPCCLDVRQSYSPLHLAGGGRPKVFHASSSSNLRCWTRASASSSWTLRPVFGAFATKLSRSAGDISAHWTGLMVLE